MERSGRYLIIIFFVMLVAFSMASSASQVDEKRSSGPGEILLKNARFDPGLQESTPSMSVNSMSSVDRYYIVQFTDNIRDEWKTEVVAAGASIFDYVPHNAFIMRMDPSVKTEVEGYSFVRWVGPYEPVYKVSTSVERSAGGSVVVCIFDPQEMDRICGDIEDLGGDVFEKNGEVINVNISGDASLIAGIEGVSWIDVYRSPVVMNDIANDILGSSALHDSHGLTGSGQIVGVVDTGLDTGYNDASMHDDLEGRVLALVDWSDNGAGDHNGHGTHVSGSVMGDGNRSAGQYKGTAPSALLVFHAVENSNGALNITSSNIPLIFQQAYDYNARIQSNSWGFKGLPSLYGNYTVFSRVVDLYMWEHPDSLVLFSAGNEGGSQNTVTPPGTAKNTLTVGGTANNLGYINAMYPSSSRGFTDDGRVKPDVVAPAYSVRSVASSLAYSSDYTFLTGTSMATPLVAGTASLVREYYVDHQGLSSPSAALVKATLINGADDMGRSMYDQGWGRVNVEGALFPAEPGKMYYFDETDGLNTSQSWNVSYDVDNSSVPLKVTLVWTDYPSGVFVGDALVNDLDLMITGPSVSYPVNGTDSTNNTEQITIESPEEGQYTILVNASNVAHGPQPFAVVVSGGFNDSVPPMSITSLSAISGETWIEWSWTDPQDPDLFHVEVYLDGSFQENVTDESFIATGLGPGSDHTIGTRTVDLSGNVNSSWVNLTSSTTVDVTAPSSITGLGADPGETWINWSWINPLNADFSHVDVYLDGVYQSDVSGTSFNVSGLSAETGYTLSTHTVDLSGNVNSSWVNSTSITTNDVTAPFSVTGLNGNPGETWINWSWTNPSDADFSHVEVYLDGVYQSDISGTNFNSTVLTAETSYTLSTRTVDLSGNINSSWVNLSSTTTADVTTPSSVTGLGSTPGETWINWSWTNPSDVDFSHVEVYLDGVPF